MEKRLRILIVAADAIEINLIRTILVQGLANIELLEAHTQAQVRELITLGQADLVLVDAGSGVTGGIGMIRYIMEPQHGIPVILMTDPATGGDALAAISIGVQDCVAKSLAHLKELPARIARLTGRQITQQYRKHLPQDEVPKVYAGFFASSPYIAVMVDKNGTIVQTTAAVSELLAYRHENLIDTSILDYCPRNERSGLSNTLTGVFTGAAGNFQVECQIRHRAGHYLHFAATAMSAGDNSGEPAYCILQFRDISDQKQSQLVLSKQSLLNRLLGDIAVASNDAASFDQALQICLEEVCAFTGWPFAHAYLVDNTRKNFTLRKFRYPENSNVDKYKELSNSINRSSVAGLPGRVMRTRRPTWESDFSQAEDFVNTEHLTGLGLKAGFAFPIFAGDDVIAILEFYCGAVTEPDFGFLEIMVLIGSQLGHVYERERTKRSLQLSEEKFAAAFRSSPDAISIISTADGEIIDVNERFLQLFSYRRHEVVGKKTGDMVLWRDPELEQTFVAALRKFGMVRDMEADLFISSGQTLNCLISAELINISRGQHALVLIRDITEIVATNAALKRSEGLFRSYFNAGFVGMAIISPENQFIQVNDTVRDIFGYSHDQLLGMSVNDLTIPEDIEESIRLFNSVAAGEIDGYAEEKHCLRKDGNIITISMLTEGVRRDDGQIDYLVAFFRDITKRVQSQNKLIKSEASLRKAQRIAHLGFWEIDLVTDELFLSEEIYSICAIDSIKFDNTRSFFSKLIHPDDYERAKLEQKKSIDSGQPFDTEYRIIRSDGKIRYVQSQGEVVRDEQNRPIRMMGTLHDITERKISEIALNRSNRALRVLNESTHTIVHATSGQEMIDTVCRIIIETGGYRFAWVGYAQNDEAKTVYPVAKAGYDTGYLDNTFSWGGDIKTFDPVSDAIATGKPSLVKNLTDIDVYGSIRNTALESGYRSAIALPLNVGSKGFGALMIYASEPDAFDMEEIMLLTSLADDLAFGILSLHTRAEHERSGSLIKEPGDIFKVLFDENPAILLTVNENGTILSVNKFGAELLGYRVEELTGGSIYELSHDVYRQTENIKIRESLENPGTVIRWEQQKICRNGIVLWDGPGSNRRGRETIYLCGF